MANYSYQSSGYSSGVGADAAFNAADTNSDGQLDLGEFSNFVGMSIIFFHSCLNSH
jgi:hypothetical protein